MCGILAGINYKCKPESLRKALSLMQHRGPDFKDDAVFDNKIYLGHNRLAILDLNERSNQPFCSDDVYIIYNGEVYNYQELIKEHHLSVRTTSDTEVVLEMYRKYGSDCLKYFNGMFAFVIFDRRNKAVFVARDRLGIKPLFYCNSGDEWIFASEIAPLQQIVQSDLDGFGVRQYRKLRMTVKDYTIYSQIKQFRPGYFWENGKFSKYWELCCDPKEPPCDEDLGRLIHSAVTLRKRSDVPLGSYLSGGLDSTILSFILRPKDTWTVGFEEMNEFEWSRKANSVLNSDYNEIVVDHDLFLESAGWMIEKRMEPLSVPNEVLIYLMTSEVKKKNTVILSGEGADELFYGYDRIFKWANNAKSLNLDEFDRYYCYGTNKDHEVLSFALEGLPGETPLQQLSYFFQIYHLHGLLRRLDNATMLCSVEARVPFVDHRVVEMLAGVSFDWKMGTSFKVPLKRIFSDLIPKEIIDRKKVGFPVPLSSIFDQNFHGETPMDKWLLFNLGKFVEDDFTNETQDGN